MSQSIFANPTAFEAGLLAAFNARPAPTADQSAALDRFAQLGLPNRKREGWKWSDYLAALNASEPGNLAIAPDVDCASTFSPHDAIEILVINGHARLPDETTPAGIQLAIATPEGLYADLKDHAFAALNQAMVRQVLEITIEMEAKSTRPIVIRHLNAGDNLAMSQAKIHVGKKASLNIIEIFDGDNTSLYSNLTHLKAEAGSSINRIVVHDTVAQSIVHSVHAATLERDVSYNQTSLSTGSRLARHETVLHFMGREISCRLNSTALVGAENHSDFTTEIVHHGEACETRQLHRGVASGRGKNIFQGKFNVLRTAQKTDAKMSANALLLSDTAEANHKPELEIYADDVECAHGSTAGALDRDALFYLRQRGLTEHQARSLLVEAFVGETLELVDDVDIRDALQSRVGQWLGEEM